MNNRTWTVIALLAAIAAWTLVPAGTTYASNEIAGKTGLVCTACHDKPGSKRLTDRGKYYELMGDLEGFEEIGEAFGSCTACHVKKAGSKRLTAEGRRLKRAIGGMDALRALVLEKHPAPHPAEEPAPEEHRGSTPSAPASTVEMMPAH